MSEQTGTKLELTMKDGGRVRIELPAYLTPEQKIDLSRLITGLIGLVNEPPSRVSAGGK